MKKIFFLLLLASMPLFAAPDGKYNWNKAKNLHPGIKHAHIYPKKPRPMKINVIRVDLKEKNIGLIATEVDKDNGKPMPDYPKLKIESKREKTRNFMIRQRKNKKNVLVAVNAGPWSPFNIKTYNNKYGGNMRLFISEYKVGADKKVLSPAFLVTRSNVVEIRAVKPDEDRGKFRIALPGFEIILTDGKVVAKDKNLHPRTCYGISADKRYLYLFSVDGRQKAVSEGAKTIECAEYLLYFGAADAINMDGGGSTTLAYWDKRKKKPVVLSRHKGGWERSVATNLGVVKK